MIAGKNNPEAGIDFARASLNAEILVGIVEARIAATVMVGHDGHRGWLYYVAVAPSLRRRGLGRRMVAEAETWLRARGAPKAQLMIRETNTQAEAFYARLGYATIPRIVMQKVLQDLRPARGLSIFSVVKNRLFFHDEQLRGTPMPASEAVVFGSSRAIVAGCAYYYLLPLGWASVACILQAECSFPRLIDGRVGKFTRSRP